CICEENTWEEACSNWDCCAVDGNLGIGTVTCHVFHVPRVLQCLQFCDLSVSCQLEAYWRIHVPASTQRKLEPCFSKACATGRTEMHSGYSVVGRVSLKKTLLTGIAVLSVALHTPAAAQSYVLRGGDKLASTFTGLSVLVPAGAHAEPSSRHVTKLYDEPGGLVSEHVMLWRKLARSGDEVEIRAMCPSACTLILAYVPRERI